MADQDAAVRAPAHNDTNVTIVREKGKVADSNTEQGKYSGKYALSEILICGECGTPYKRRIWTKRSGEKMPAWRCISRLECATKYCKESPTVLEENLHTAIIQAIRDTRANRQEMIPFFNAHME